MPAEQPNDETSDAASSADGEQHLGLVTSAGTVDRDALFALYESSAAVDDDQSVTVTFKLNHDLNKRLDRYLVDRVPFLSRTALQRLIDEDAVRVNGRVAKASTKLRKGDVVIATLPPPPSSEIPAEEMPLDILFEDGEVIVINKAPGLIVHPARSHKSGTLINGLAWHFQHRTSGQLSTVGKEFARPGVVHRLDKHTSGVMIAAKTDTAHWRLGKQFELRQTQKRYLALVHGHPEPHADVIDLPMGKHPTIKERYAVRHDDTGKPSQTVYRVLEEYAGYALVELELRTGRTHQIRVHMSHIGYPLVGDDMYGGTHVTMRDFGGDSDEPLLTRQALHAALLGVRHPISNEPMTFLAPLWSDLRTAVDLLRKHRFDRSLSVGGTLVGVPPSPSA
ncbi:MAG: RluA family pseudouridine synthase [Phycisphaerales bacterium]|nr:RluA family pseudouridine synthase [Phycisphaerales bacterium]